MPGERTQPRLSAGEERTYRDDEVARLLQRAARLERVREPERPTLSLAEVEAIAREAGIDPALVRQAARDLETERQRGLGARLAGAPVHRVFERSVEGEISERHHERLAAELRAWAAGFPSAMGVQVSAVGRTLSCTAGGGSALVEIQIAPQKGRTVIRIDVNTSRLAGGLFGGIIGGLGGGLGTNVAWILPALLHLPAAAGVLGFAGVIGGAYGLARSLFAWRAGVLHERVERLADALAAAVAEELANR